MKKPFWPRGAQAALAKLSGVSANRINDILHRRVNCSRKQSSLLAGICEYLYLKNIIPAVVPEQEWVFNNKSSHPAFFGKPSWKV